MSDPKPKPSGLENTIDKPAVHRISSVAMRELRKANQQLALQAARFGYESDQAILCEQRLIQACRNLVQEDDDS